MDEKPKRIFTLAPVEDDIGAVLKDARRKLLSAHGVSDGAKAVGCLVLDLSMDRATNRGPGILVISDAALAQLYGCAERSLYRWKRQLEHRGFIYLKRQFMPNTHPMTKYVLACLHPDDESTPQPTHDGLWGGGRLRSAPGAGNGGECSTRSITGQFCRQGGSGGNAEKPAKNDKNAPPYRQTSPLPADRIAPASGKRGRCQRQSLPLPAANVAAASGQNCSSQRQTSPLPADTNDTCQRTQTAVLRRARVGGTSVPHEGERDKTPPPVASHGEKGSKTGTEGDALAVWRQSLNGWFPSRLEKMRAKLAQQRKETQDPSARDFIKRKIAMLDELLEGPPPPTDPNPAPKPTAKPANAASAPKPPTEEELVAGAEYLVSVGKLATAPKNMREAYARHLASRNGTNS